MMIQSLYAKFYSYLITAGLLLLASTGAMAQSGASLTVHQVGPGDASSIFSYFNTSPESPDGKLIAYVYCKNEPSGDKGYAAAELWVCNSDLSHHRKVVNISGTTAHDGAKVQWVDNNRIAFFDHDTIRIVSVATGKDLLKRKIKASGIGHYAYQNKILYYINPGMGTPEKNGIHELDCNTQQSRLIISTASCANTPLPSYLEKGEIIPVDEWRVFHAQYSPDGKAIHFRLDVGPSPGARLQGVCDSDGSDLVLTVKQLHQVWYDNKSIVSHLRFYPDGKTPPKEKEYSLVLSDLKGNVLKELAPPGNHLAVSPDRQWFASESYYETNPVVLTLYPNGHPEKAIEVVRFDPLGVTWKRRFHVNPSFSRDGKRLYFSMPLNEKFNGTFYVDIK